MPNPPTDIVDFTGLDSSIILMKGWNSHVHGEFPRKFESSKVNRDNVSRGIGCAARAVEQTSVYYAFCSHSRHWGQGVDRGI